MQLNGTFTFTRNNMNKPKYIEAKYSAFLTWDLEELGVDWDKVEDYSKET